MKIEAEVFSPCPTTLLIKIGSIRMLKEKIIIHIDKINATVIFLIFTHP